MNKAGTWKWAAVGLLVVASVGSACAQSGIATAPSAARRTVNPADPASQPEVSGPSTATVRAGGSTHKVRKPRKAASGAASAASH